MIFFLTLLLAVFFIPVAECFPSSAVKYLNAIYSYNQILL